VVGSKETNTMRAMSPGVKPSAQHVESDHPNKCTNMKSVK
jgi:hypothetical protein